jgi:hypothetical protein
MKTVLLVGAIVVGGAAVGVGLERAGFFSPIGEPVVEVSFDEAVYYACPGGDELGTFLSGDRVWITGRSLDGAMLEVRAPFNTSLRVWVLAGEVDADGSLEGLSVADCGVPETTTTTEGPDESSTTSTEASTSTTSTTEVPTSTTTTTEPPPADTQGPVISVFQSSPDDIWENGGYGGCPTQPQTADVGGFASDPSGIQSVWIDWSVGSSSGTVAAPEIAENFFFAQIGPFADTTVNADTPVYLQMTAYDNHGNQTVVSSSSELTLHNCVVG